MKKLFILFVICLSGVSCRKDPAADFSMLGSFKVSDTVYFTNLSSNFKSSSWDFGDGNTSLEESPRHVYVKPGNYQINLVVTGSGKTTSVSKNVSILGTTYEIKNNTAITLFDFASFYWNGTEIVDFMPYGTLEGSQSTGIIETTRPDIEFGFRFDSTGDLYFGADPFMVTQGTHNTFVIDNNTQIFGGGSKSAVIRDKAEFDSKVIQFEKLLKSKK